MCHLLNFLFAFNIYWVSTTYWRSLSGFCLFATLWTIQSMEFSRPEYWSGEPFPSPRAFPYPGIEPRYRTQVSLIAGGFFTIWATRETHLLYNRWWTTWFTYVLLFISATGIYCLFNRLENWGSERLNILLRVTEVKYSSQSCKNNSFKNIFHSQFVDDLSIR